MHPILFEPFGHPITSFGVMFALAFMGGWMFTLKMAKRTGWFAEETISDLLFWLMIGGPVGARLVYVIVHWDDFAHDPVQALYIWKGGIVSYGGFIGAFVAGWIFTRRRKLDFLQLADMCVPGAMLGQSIGRIGCFLVGDDYGRPAPEGLPWAVTFPRVPGSLLPDKWQGVPLHPTQLYMMLKAFLIFLVLWFALEHRKFKGQVLCLVMMLYPVGRSIVEFYRGDAQERGVYFGISTAQWISIPVFALGLWLYFKWSRRAAATSSVGR